MSEIGEVIANMGDNNIMENSDAPAEEPPTYHTKRFRIGSGNIIGKGVIQDFFTCAGALPSMGSSILHRTSSLADSTIKKPMGRINDILIAHIGDNFPNFRHNDKQAN